MRRGRRGKLMQFLLAVGLYIPVGAPAWSQQADVPNESAKPTVEDLIRRLDAYEAELRALRAQTADQIPTQTVSNTSAGKNIESRLTSLEKIFAAKSAEDKGVDTSKEKLSVKVGGRIMYDGTYGTDRGLEDILGSRFQNGHEFRRVRLFASGKGYGIFDYKVQIDFADFNDPVAKDIYLGLTESPIGKFRIGHFKEPFSLEELTSSKYITFIERALPNAMSPSRSAGFMFFDNWGDDMGTWEVGSFFDDIQQTSTASDGNVDNADSEFRSFNFRVTRLLLNDEAADGRYLAHVGGSFRFADARDQSLRFRARPEIHDTFRTLGVLTGDTDDYIQWGAEAAGVWGPASIQAEYIATHFDSPSDPMIWGTYVYVSYFLTGEHRPYSHSRGSFGRVKPLENFWWVNADDEKCSHGSGAWELAARWSYLDYDDTGLAPAGGTSGTRGELSNFTFGVNWYWNPHMRVMFNYVHSELDDSVTALNADTDAFLSRFQIDF